MNICILKLEQNKYFVGKTNFLYETEVIKDFKKNSNSWLDIYPIIKIIKIFPISYFGTTEEEKTIELNYEIKKIMDILIIRYSIENVKSFISVKKDNKINYKIKTFTPESDWYEEFERQEKASSFNMYSSPCASELYLNLEWSEILEQEPQSPFNMFYLKNYYNMEEKLLKSSYL